MADFFSVVEPEREDLEVECRECRKLIRASSAIIRETMATSERAVLSVRRFYYCSAECAEELSVESSEAVSDGGVETDPEQRDSYMVVPSMDESETRHEAVGKLAVSRREGRDTALDKRVVVVKQPEFTQMMRGEGR